MRIALVAVFALVVGIAPLAGHAFVAQNGLEAQQVGPTEIAVIPRVRADTTDYWCAAGDFAVRVMGLANRTRIYRASESPRKAGQGIVFTLDPAKAAIKGGMKNFGPGPKDGSVSLGHAVGNFCRPFVPLWWD